MFKIKLQYLILAPALALMAFVGCQSPTKYKAQAGGDYGYTSKKLKNNIYRVTFTGNDSTKRSTVEDYLIYRAAELTENNDFKYFEILAKDEQEILEVDRNYRSSAMAAPYTTGLYRYSNYRYPYYSARAPWSYVDDKYTLDEAGFEILAYVKMYPKKPKDRDVRAASSIVDKMKTESKFSQN